MTYKIICCNCKKEISVQDKEMFFVVQPTILENAEWKRVRYGGFAQLILCINCLRKKRKWKK